MRITIKGLESRNASDALLKAFSVHCTDGDDLPTVVSTLHLNGRMDVAAWIVASYANFNEVRSLVLRLYNLATAHVTHVPSTIALDAYSVASDIHAHMRQMRIIQSGMSALTEYKRSGQLEHLADACYDFAYAADWTHVNTALIRAITKPITNKVKDVPDEVCAGCGQLYKGECRAFSMPQSGDELKARCASPGMACMESTGYADQAKRRHFKGEMSHVSKTTNSACV